MIITFRDELGCLEVAIDESGISSDGQNFFFSDNDGRDYCVPVANVLFINRT